MAENQRLFFALSLPQEIREQIQDWRTQALPWHTGHPIAQENYHLTLAFLGEVSPGQRQRLCRLAGRIQQPAFRLTLDDAGHWPRSGAVWIGPKHPPRGLNQLANLLRSQAARSGCYQAPMPFHPHVTLYRQVHQAIALPAPGFSWSFAVEKFTLFSATLKQSKTRYQPIDAWSLLPQKET